MPHPLVAQLRFTRSEFLRGLEGVSAGEAARRLGSMNSLAWIAGHLAWHEQALWLERAQDTTLAPEVKACGFGKPPSTPDLEPMLAAWRRITAAADPYLDGLTAKSLLEHWQAGDRRHPESVGTSLQRLIYHYWFHTGEAQAMRQMLGHRDLPTFVGDINTVPYVPEAGG